MLEINIVIFSIIEYCNCKLLIIFFFNFFEFHCLYFYSLMTF